MLGLIFIIVSFYIGFHVLRIFLPETFAVSARTTIHGNPFVLPGWMVYLPAAYLIGTLLLTWSTYMSAYLLRSTGKAMLFGNAIVLSTAVLLCVLIFFKNRKHYQYIFKEFKKYSGKKVLAFYGQNKVELLFVFISLLVSSYIMFYTFNIKNGYMFIGQSVWGDFGPHLSVIRSFSWGANFPTEYPHFPAGNIRYHFLFQFLAGNLEFLGLRIDWAFNIPSILSLVSFFMLLYSFAVILLGKRFVGILASVLFFFRSSFAFFTYIADIKPGTLSNIWETALSNMVYAGKTVNENWGLWTQNVYVNQRHLAFSLSIMLYIFIMILPLFIDYFKHLAESNTKIFLFNKHAWLPDNPKRAIALGIILGLISFWNGAVVFATLPVLFFMAILSKHRLEYLIIAAITTLLSVFESNLFIGSAASTVNPKLIFGFLAEKEELNTVLSNYVEMLGILPFIIAIGLFIFPKKRNSLGLIIVIPLTVYLSARFMPDSAQFYKYLLFGAVLMYAVAVNVSSESLYPHLKGIRWLTFAFLSPLIMATTVKLTPDINANHKFIIISVILLNIVAAYILYHLFTSKVTAIKLLSVLLVVIMTVTGVEDFITLKNINSNNRSVQIKTDDEIMLWVAKNTSPDEIFLTEAHVLHPILLAGRKLLYGWPYYAWSAGYNTLQVEDAVKQIYGGKDIDKVKALINKYKISYIVIEAGNRSATVYTLNETLIRDNFSLVYENKQRNISIYKTY